MESPKAQRLGSRQGPKRPLSPMRARIAAVGSLVAVAVITVAIVVAFALGSASTRSSATRSKSTARRPSAAQSAKLPGTAAVPILAYDVINVAPPQTALPPSLYVPVDEFSAQMSALSAAGWRAVTLDQLEAYWTGGSTLGTSEPIVITFDGGYASHYTNALPILKRLGWAAVENLPVNGLPASEGGLTDVQIRGLIASGWELDTQGIGTADLTTLGAAELSYELTTARQALRNRYGTPVNWLSYPSGACDATVTAAVRSAGFVGATTLVAGWANPRADRFSLPRLQVLAGTSPSSLLSEITSAQAVQSTPAASPCA